MDITISRDGGPFIDGQSYNLTCTVTLENAARAPTVEWLDPNNNPLDNNSDITVGDTVTVNCSTYTTTLPKNHQNDSKNGRITVNLEHLAVSDSTNQILFGRVVFILGA